MCFFLTVAVPARHAGRIDGAFGRGFQTHVTANPSVTAALPAGYEARLVTSGIGMCSCGLYAPPRAAATTDPTAHLRRRYERLGWSQAKIQRALAQAAASASKRDQPASGLRDDVVERLVALCRAAGSVAFLVHWYDEDIETEHLPLRRAVACDCDELPAQAQQLAQDEVIVATARWTSCPEYST